LMARPKYRDLIWLVDVAGLEPATPAMQMQCSPS
jgi:hypothetical protein